MKWKEYLIMVADFICIWAAGNKDKHGKIQTAT
jgi:hypothetical protein